jgi:serine O-acetyltransferase
MDVAPDLRADLRHITAKWDASGPALALAALLRAPLYPAVRAALWTRLGMWCWQHRLRPLALWCRSRCLRATGADIHPGARIGPGLNLVHTSGIVVGREVVAGRDLVLYQGVTLGHGSRGDGGQPTIGDGVRIFAGAAVLGGVRLGDGALVSAGAQVLSDVADGVRVRGTWRGPERDLR